MLIFLLAGAKFFLDFLMLSDIFDIDDARRKGNGIRGRRVRELLAEPSRPSDVVVVYGGVLILPILVLIWAGALLFRNPSPGSASKSYWDAEGCFVSGVIFLEKISPW